MEDNPTWLLVVAAALLDHSGKVLMHRRPEGKPHAGLWEFPGGKVEPAEFPADALSREIYEELGIRVEARGLVPVTFAQTAAGEVGPPIVILLYSVTHWEGVPAALEGGLCGWFTFSEASELPMPPLDQRLFATLAARFAD